VLFANIREWQALTTSRDAFPQITREDIRRLQVPVLMLSGGKTYPMLRLTDDELERHLRNGRRQIIPNGTHEVCSEEPSTCAVAIRAFLAQARR
jgi:pimeloyl-ACP methyl ester carboxylesterase